MKKFLVFAFFIIQITFTDQPTQNLHRYMLANYYQFGADMKQAAHWYGQITPGRIHSMSIADIFPCLPPRNHMIRLCN